MSLVQKCIQSITFQGFNAKANNPGQLTHHRPWSLLYWPFDIVSRRVEQTTWSSYGWFQGKILYEANKIGRIITKHLASPKWAGNECQWESKYLQEGSPIKNNTKKVKRKRGGRGLINKKDKWALGGHGQWLGNNPGRCTEQRKATTQTCFQQDRSGDCRTLPWKLQEAGSLQDKKYLGSI